MLALLSSVLRPSWRGYNDAIAAVEPRLEEAMEALDFLLA
jgi:hypothetical protein